MFVDTGRYSLRRRRQAQGADLDITPMIDVTFLLLVFFMVTSTMQIDVSKDLPPAVSGDNANMQGYRDLAILSPTAPGVDSRIQLDGKERTLDELQRDIEQLAAIGPVKLMISAERDARNGFVGEVEMVINQIDGDIEYKFAVLDRR